MSFITQQEDASRASRMFPPHSGQVPNVDTTFGTAHMILSRATELETLLEGCVEAIIALCRLLDSTSGKLLEALPIFDMDELPVPGAITAISGTDASPG